MNLLALFVARNNVITEPQSQPTFADDVVRSLRSTLKKLSSMKNQIGENPLSVDAIKSLFNNIFTHIDGLPPELMMLHMSYWFGFLDALFYANILTSDEVESIVRSLF